MTWFWLHMIAFLASPDAGVLPTEAAPPIAQGPAPTVEMDCAPNPVRIGDTLVCSVTMDHRADFVVDVLGPDIFRMGEAPTVEEVDSNTLRTVQQVEYRVRALKKVMVRGLKVRWIEPSKAQGIVEIPSQRVPYESVLISTLAEDRKPRTFQTPDPELTDDSEDTDARLAFIKAHGPIEYLRTEWSLIYGLGALFLLLLGPFVWILIKRARHYFWPPEDEGPWVDPRPAHVIAYEQLHQLKAEQLPEQDLHESYYVRISEIFRGYLKRRFEINGLEMTSEEIRRWSDDHLESSVRAPLHDFLSETDIVKFANVVPNTEELETITGQAESFIEETREADDVGSDGPVEDQSEGADTSTSLQAGPTPAPLDSDMEPAARSSVLQESIHGQDEQP